METLKQFITRLSNLSYIRSLMLYIHTEIIGIAQFSYIPVVGSAYPVPLCWSQHARKIHIRSLQDSPSGPQGFALAVTLIILYGGRDSKGFVQGRGRWCIGRKAKGEKSPLWALVEGRGLEKLWGIG